MSCIKDKLPIQKKRLNRTIQCKNCPWKVVSTPNKIEGYNIELHKNLLETIATGWPIQQLENKQLKAMACHHSTDENAQYCIGWLNNQLGVGNNIKLRLMMLEYENAHEIKIVGEQCQNFEQTFR